MDHMEWVSQQEKGEQILEECWTDINNRLFPKRSFGDMGPTSTLNPLFVT